MKKLYLSLVTFVFLFVFGVSSASAFTVYEVSGSIGLSSPTYHADTDKYVVTFIPDNVYSTKKETYASSDYVSVTTSKDYTGGGFIGISDYTCNSFYKETFYDSSGNVIGVLKFQSTEIVNPTCLSDVPQEEPSDTNEECSSVVCECINQLKGVNSDILNSTNSNGTKLSSIVSNTNVLPNIDDNVENILGELQTTTPIDYPSMPEAPSLESNKPSMPSDSYEDTSTTFQDKGDAAEPDSLPLAPEPDPWKDNDGNAMSADEELVKDEEKVKDPVGEKDSVPTQDSVPTKDSVPTQDSVPTKDPIGNKDPVPTQDPTNERSPVNNPSSVPSRDNVNTRDPVPNKDPVDNTLPTLESN